MAEARLVHHASPMMMSAVAVSCATSYFDGIGSTPEEFTAAITRERAASLELVRLSGLVARSGRVVLQRRVDTLRGAAHPSLSKRAKRPLGGGAVEMGTTADPNNMSVAEMERFVARFDRLRGSEEAFVDSKLPGGRRFKINLIGMGVVERDDVPDLKPNIPLPATGFNLGMIQAEKGNGASLHSHTTEEVFMPLIGPWEVYWQTPEGEKSLVLQPFDCIHVPVGVYRGFRHVGEGMGTLLTIIGGPDAGKVAWEPGVLARAAAMGISRDASGQVHGIQAAE
jgi:mannose-6-phosphate isomerase-like protein (cupin superfamily)